ncbi:MAG: propionyl-CoA synthetase, partial [Polaribacter sp.]
MNYNEYYAKSIVNPGEFWKEQANLIEWYNKPEITLSEDDNGYPLWYKDGELNLCYLALDKHIEDGHGDQVAFIYDSPVTQTIRKYTFSEAKT